MNYFVIASTVVAMFMAVTMIFVRMKAAKKPASIKKIILPPIMMSTGAFMYVFPMFRISFLQVAEALGVGILFSILLIVTSKFEIRETEIYLIPSKIFILVLVGLLVVRVILKSILGHVITLGETSGMFFMLAFGMIISWRLAMLFKFIKLQKALNEGAVSTIKSQTTT
ncbi:CcdC family protein [Salirhabdus sp. Marseille-P4669]|uniref:CcdC family protein n=1 Tax=Salirhabdus sp. Marseille-P4669 TaxID=2042310 RepID=UPI000C7D422A|nr:cytochrome c biogenesis protein CcdC [Salirhabdus sp. Marseille-P4669]